MVVAHILARLVRGSIVGMLRRWPSTLLALSLLIGGTLVAGSRGLIPGLPALAMTGLDGTSVGTAEASDAREIVFEDLEQVRGGDQIKLILKEKSGNRRLVMMAGLGEALAIAGDRNGARSGSEQPKTYDLMRSLVQELGGRVERVVVNNVTETTFYAKVVMRIDDRQIEVDSRPSDAIALALRAKAPIFAEVSVLDKAGVLNPR